MPRRIHPKDQVEWRHGPSRFHLLNGMKVMLFLDMIPMFNKELTNAISDQRRQRSSSPLKNPLSFKSCLLVQRNSESDREIGDPRILVFRCL